MKKLIIGLFVFATFAVTAGEKVGKLEVGDKAVMTNVKMKSVTGTSVSLSDVSGKNGTLVIFSCNSCPFVLRWEDRYPGLKEYAAKNGIGMIVLNSNYQNRDGADSFTAMVDHADEKGYNFDYVLDKESQIANAFGGQTTPHVFLFDGDMELVYKGLIDDNSASAADVKKDYLNDALASLGQGKEVAIAETPPQGCSIKRKLD
ncbi:MAG: redoxin domain-containing protein [Mariniphaga sp.]|nr:redoxin domain-containing protein [Mariniphaga sp.]